MKQHVLHLLALSHSYSTPSLKRVCIYVLEQGWLTKENVIDVLQLARNCDAPRLSFLCIRTIIGDFKTISSTEGWKVMKHTNPALEQELLECVVEADSVSQFLHSFKAYLFYFNILMKRICAKAVSNLYLSRGRHRNIDDILYALTFSL